MSSRYLLTAALLFLLTGPAGSAQDAAAPPGDKEPLLRLEAGGPTALVTALAFSPDGKTLYAAGFDKVVRVWALDEQTGRFRLDPRTYYRVPIGPGFQGAINALALSPDGTWLAVAGHGVVRDTAGFRQAGKVLSTDRMSADMLQDLGTIYVFHTRSKAVRLLRGHKGPVMALAFAPERKDKRWLLVSAARERQAAAAGKYEGAVQVWDLGQETKEPRRLKGLPDPGQQLRPGLAPWYRGPQQQLHVALAWPDGHLRVWDLESGPAKVWKPDTDAFLTTAVSLPAGGGVLTGSFRKQGGGLQVWDVERRPAKPERQVSFPPSAQGVPDLPLGLTLFASRNRGPLDHAAVALLPERQPGKPEGKLRLHLVALAPARFQTVKEVVLWRDSKFPVVAAVPGGRHLAVAGHEDHTILVFALADLLAKPRPEPQVLSSVGARIDQVAFRRRGPDLGLWLQEKALVTDDPGAPRRDPVRGGLVFDFRQQRLTADQADWKPAGPDLGGWRVEQVPAGKAPRGPGVTLYKDGGEVGRIELQRAQGVTAAALLPPLNRKAPPLVAVAWLDQDALPQLGLYLATGEQVRQLTGHVDWVRSLAFSADGRLLASAADDQTVSVWSLADLDHGRPAGVDEQKPLLSLFVTGQGPPEQRAWIGWNPIGPYESSKGAAHLLGWHFNPGARGAATQFALVDQYRNDYQSAGILQRLLDEGRVPPPRPPQPPPAPRLTLHIGPDPEKVDGHRHLLVREPLAALRLEVDNYPPDKVAEWVERVQWRVNDGPPQPFAPPAGREPRPTWSADLTRLPRAPDGVYKVRAVLRTKEAEPKDYTEELTVRYQPKPPEVQLLAPAADQTWEQQAMALKAVVKPGQPNQAVEVRILQGQREILPPQVIRAPRELNPRLQLQPGPNPITIRAVNVNALPGYESEETAERRVLITFVPPQVDQPPDILLQKVVPLTAGGEEGRPLEIVPGQPLPPVWVPEVRIVGQIRVAANAKPLQTADWSHGGAPKPLTAFDPTKLARTLDFSEPVRLKPGDNQLRFKAETANRGVREVELAVFYRPPLPELKLTAPDPELRLYEGRHPPAVELKGVLKFPHDLHDYKAEVRVNEQPPVEPAIHKAMGSLSARVPLQPGTNVLQVRLSNAWGAVSESEPVRVYYRRPPVIQQFTGPAESQAAFVDLQAVILSPSPLEPEVEVEVNGTPTTLKVALPELPPADHQWKLELKQVALGKAGKNDIRLWVANAEARSLESRVWTVVKKEAPKPPVITFTDLPNTVANPRLKVGFVIRSAKPLRQVKLERKIDQGQPLLVALDVTKLAGVPGGYAGEEVLDLKPGTNYLSLIADNDDGRGASAQVPVSCTYRPVDLVVEQLVPRTGAPPIKPQRDADGTFVFRDAVAAPLVGLEGRILGSEEQLQKVDLFGVWVYVNGIRQFPAELQPAPDRSARTFRAPLLLNRDRGNQIEIELPREVNQEASNRPAFTLDCRKPKAGQRLHLLILGPGALDENDLRQRALQAVQATVVDLEKNRFQTPAFAEGILYRPHTDSYFTRNHLNTYRKAILRTMEAFARRDALIDVVMVYYQGPESVDPQGRSRWSTLTWEEISSQLTDLPGAQVLLLDVQREESVRDDRAPWSGDPRISVMRCAWLGGTVPPPEDARLITALKEAMSQGSKLQEVASQLSSKYDRAAQNYPKSLRYDKHVPPILGELVVGGRP